MKSKILFLCTGNYYRSRYAEVLFNAWAKEENLNWEAFSRGLRPSPNNPGEISIFTRRVLEEKGLMPENPRFPLSLIEEDLQASDWTIAMKDTEHRPMMQEQFPDWENEITYWEIHDIDKATPKEALPKIEEKLKEIIQKIKLD